MADEMSPEKQSWMRQNLGNILEGKTFKDAYGVSYLEKSKAKMDRNIVPSGFPKTPEQLVREDLNFPIRQTADWQPFRDVLTSNESIRGASTAYDALMDKQDPRTGEVPNVKDVILNMTEERYYADIFNKYNEELEALNENFTGPYMEGDKDSQAYRDLKIKAFRSVYDNIDYPFMSNEYNERVVNPDSPYSIENMKTRQIEASPEFVPAMSQPGDPGYEKTIINNMVDNEESFLE